MCRKGIVCVCVHMQEEGSVYALVQKREPVLVCAEKGIVCACGVGGAVFVGVCVCREKGTAQREGGILSVCRREGQCVCVCREG